MQWRKWPTSGALDAKRGPLETGDFDEIGNFGENRRARGLAISRMWRIFKLDAKNGPFKLDN